MLIRLLDRTDFEEIRRLAATAESEGFRFLHRLVEDLQNRPARLDPPTWFFLCVVDNNAIIGVGGITPDPYSGDPAVGRVRHLYIHPSWRRSGLGRRLLHELETRASGCYSLLRLRTDNPAAARFYETLGYSPVHEDTATHIRVSF